MRTLIVTEFMSLDGVVDSPGGGDHPHAGWSFKDVEFDEAAYEIKGREQEEAGALLMGRQTYQEFAPIWPTMTVEFGRYNELDKYVVSTTLSDDEVAAADWQPTTVLRSLDEVAELKKGEGAPILVHASPNLVQTLAAADLVDRYHLLVFPLVLGSGKRLFTSYAEKQRLRLVESETYGNGIVKLVYDVLR